MTQLLLLHGALSSQQQFQPLLPLLNPQLNARAIDFSGHGQKPLHSGSYSIQLFSIDVLENIDEPVDLFGYSMGGYVAMYLALKNPLKVNRVMTLATKFHWNRDLAAAECARLVPDMLLEKAPDFVESLQKQHPASSWIDVVQNTAHFLTDLGNHNYLSPESMGLFFSRAHLALGEKDKMVTLSETETMYKALPQANLTILPDTPHQFERMDMRVVADLMNGFFAS